MNRRELSSQQEADAQALAAKIHEQMFEDVLKMARGLVGREDHELLGAGEFEVRDRVHQMGAKAIETAYGARHHSDIPPVSIDPRGLAKVMDTSRPPTRASVSQRRRARPDPGELGQA